MTTTYLLEDIHGNKLSGGDVVLVYVQRYAREKDASGVWVVDQSKPLPVADIPMAQGMVVWDEDLLAWTVRYSWVCDAWRGKAAAQLGGGNYAYERINP
jgi:hypothetical protein